VGGNSKFSDGACRLEEQPAIRTRRHRSAESALLLFVIISIDRALHEQRLPIEAACLTELFASWSSRPGARFSMTRHFSFFLRLF
jgi:hypothetical protein